MHVNKTKQYRRSRDFHKVKIEDLNWICIKVLNKAPSLPKPQTHRPPFVLFATTTYSVKQHVAYARQNATKGDSKIFQKH